MRAKPNLTNLLRIGLSLVALILLFRTVGGQEVLQLLWDANLGLLALAWVLFLVGIMVRAFRWRALLYGLGLRPSFPLLLRLYLVGGFFNVFLPSGFGGDVVRVLELGNSEQDEASGEQAPSQGATESEAPPARLAALGTVLVDRLTGILSLMAMGLVVLPFAQGLTTAVISVFVAVAVSGLAAGALLLEGTLLRRLT
ncbi:MAG: lysylphosphatidylglycerol synthase transmembrane domain-containing protein, partial [Anaerolineae bacterium]